MLAQIALEVSRVHESRVAFGGIRGTEERYGPRMQDGIVYIPFRLEINIIPPSMFGANQLIVRTVLCPQSNNVLQRKICTVPLLSEHPIGRLWR